MNISSKNDDANMCLKKKSTINLSDCQCDRGFKLDKVNKENFQKNFYLNVSYRIIINYHVLLIIIELSM